MAFSKTSGQSLMTESRTKVGTQLLLSNFDSLALAAGAALNTLGDGAALVQVGNPALVVVLAIGPGDHGGLGGLVAGDGGDELGLAHLLGGLGALLLGKQRLNPRLVNEVEGGSEDARQEDVQEDAAETQSA